MRWRLHHLLSVQIALITVLPLVAIVIFALVWMVPQMRTEIEARQQAVAYTLAGQVEVYLSSAQNELVTIATQLRQVPSGGLKRMQDLLDVHVGAGERFENITLLDAGGVGVVVGLPPRLRNQRATLLAADFSRRPFFQEVRQGDKPVWSDTFLSVMSGQLSVALALPLGERVLVGEIALNELSHFIGVTAERANAVTMIVDGAGSLVAHPRFELTGQQISLRHLPVVTDGLRGVSAVREFDFDGVSTVGMSVPVPQLGWLVLVTQPSAQAFRQLHLAGRVLAAALLVALLVSVAGGLRIAYAQASRIEVYARNARSLANGDYALPWPEERVRELFELSDHLKRMAEAIRSREQALREAMMLQHAILDYAGHAIISTTVDGTITSFNHAAERMLGYRADEVVGRVTPEIVHEPAEVAARAAEFTAVLDTPVEPGFEVFVAKARRDLANEHEWTYVRKDGSRFPVLLTVTALRDTSGSINGFLGIAIDLSERKRAEAALRTSELQLRATLDNTPGVAVQWFDRHGRVLYWNAASEKLYAIPSVQAVGKTLRELLHTPEQFREFLSFIATIERGGVPFGPAEIDIRSAHGVEVSVLYTMFMIPGGGDEPIFVCMDVDISERKRAEAELQRHREHLEELVEARTAQLEVANRELEAFSYSVSHDLRAPLRAIDGFSRIVLEDHGAQLDAEARDYLERVRKAVQRMGAQIDELLELSRVGRTEIHQTDVDLTRLATEVVEQLRAGDPARTVRVTIASTLSGRGDERLLRLVLENLLGNAWKYTRHTTDARIEFGAMQQNHETVYGVRDNGIGFDMAYVDKLYKPFQRLHRAEEYEGTGVGLAIVARVVTRHGGRVWAEATPGEGARFFFTLSEKQLHG